MIHVAVVVVVVRPGSANLRLIKELISELVVSPQKVVLKHGCNFFFLVWSEGSDVGCSL